MQPKWSNIRPTTFVLRKYFMVIQSLAWLVWFDRHERRQITQCQKAGASCVLTTQQTPEMSVGAGVLNIDYLMKSCVASNVLSVISNVPAVIRRACWCVRVCTEDVVVGQH